MRGRGGIFSIIGKILFWRATIRPCYELHGKWERPSGASGCVAVHGPKATAVSMRKRCDSIWFSEPTSPHAARESHARLLHERTRGSSRANECVRGRSDGPGAVLPSPIHYFDHDLRRPDGIPRNTCKVRARSAEPVIERCRWARGVDRQVGESLQPFDVGTDVARWWLLWRTAVRHTVASRDRAQNTRVGGEETCDVPSDPRGRWLR